MTHHASRGDPRRSMALLWGRYPVPSRGPKPGLDVATIVGAAIAIADEDGLDGVSMRRISDRLGFSAMSIYTYVPGKAELTDLMLDQVLGELAREVAMDRGWRAAVEASARDRWAFYLRHPWVLQISSARALLGPNELAAYEAQLRLFDGLGLSGVEMTRAVSAVGNFVRGAARAVCDARAAEKATGMSDDEWWRLRAPLLSEMASDLEERFPLLHRLDQENAFDQSHRADDGPPYTVQEAMDAFEFGLARLLDGLAAFVARAARVTASSG
jgi:AcrR family transcriptional regulator